MSLHVYLGTIESVTDTLILLFTELKCPTQAIFKVGINHQKVIYLLEVIVKKI